MQAVQTSSSPSRRRSQPAAGASVGGRDVWLYLLLASLIAAAWALVHLTGLKSASDAGYWLGVAGGSLMVLLFAYPLRKRLRFMQRWGASKWWFLVHMFMGIAGPLLVLVHSTFQVGSINAAVALYSMLIVAGSGVVGRFLYLRIHRGLNGQREDLDQLRAQLGLQQQSMHAALALMPAIEAEMLAFERQAEVAGHLAAFGRLPLQRLLAERRARHALQRALAQPALCAQWSPRRRAEALAEMGAQVHAYLQAVVRLAQYDSATRLFSLWHVLHVPFVYLMVLCAIAHVIAVHAY